MKQYHLWVITAFVLLALMITLIITSKPGADQPATCCPRSAP